MLSGWFAGDAWRLRQERRMFSFYLFIFANDPGGKYLLEGRARRGTNETRRPGGEGHPPGVSPLLPPACPEGCPGCARLGSSGGGAAGRCTKIRRIPSARSPPPPPAPLFRAGGRRGLPQPLTPHRCWGEGQARPGGLPPGPQHPPEPGEGARGGGGPEPPALAAWSPLPGARRGAERGAPGPPPLGFPIGCLLMASSGGGPRESGAKVPDFRPRCFSGDEGGDRRGRGIPRVDERPPRLAASKTRPGKLKKNNKKVEGGGKKSPINKSPSFMAERAFGERRR